MDSHLEAFLKEQDFWKSDTKDAVIELYVSLLDNRIDHAEALSCLESITSAMKSEYGE